MTTSSFDTIVSGFYRAATGESDWNAALQPLQQAFGARAAVLHSVDMRSGQMMGFSIGGPPMHESELDYIRTYHQIDPRRAFLLAGGADLLGQWWHCHEHLREDFVAQDRFYQEFMPATGARFQSTVVLKCSDHVIAGLALELPATRGVLSPQEREQARRLGAHMQDALRAYQRVRQLAAQSLAGHTLLANFPYPMWLIDAERHIHFANPAAQRETDGAARLVQHGAQLLHTNARHNIKLTEQLHLLRDAAHGRTAVVNLQAHRLHQPVWLHLCVLVPQAALGAFGDRPLVLATLFDPQQVSPLDPFALAAVLKLTPAQAKVAAQLADGLTAEEIATANGTSVATVRTHVRDVLLRMGAKRITDAVRMLRQGQALWTDNGMAA